MRSYPSTRARRSSVSLCLAIVAMVGMARPLCATTQSAKAKKARAKSSTVKPAPTPDLTSSLQTFCEEWMDKLRAREKANVSTIKWETEPDGVRGSYVGYSTGDHSCTLADGHTQVARIKYQEVRYQKVGATIGDAEKSQPQPIEVFDTTELFHYSKGKWDY
jgi:hypothetical protein